MPTAKFYLNGLTMGMGGNPNPVYTPRGEVVGWSRASVRRHARWLYGVDTTTLGANGFSLTLTLRECPPTHVEWQTLRRRYVDALTASGVVVRGHWVTEWTRRKVPHLHLAVYIDEPMTETEVRDLLVVTWLTLAGKYGSRLAGQHMAPITGVLGWLEYLSKHAARGVNHYQRAGKPSGWTKTGRLWGHFGTWPIVDPIEATMGREEFWRFRRLVRSWRVADARSISASGTISYRRVASARRMLRCNDRDLSQVRGVSEWIPERVGLVLLDLAGRDRE